MNQRIQIVRGLSICAVLVIHTYNVNPMHGGGYGVIIRPLVNFAVGMFVFLSGFLTKENEDGRYGKLIGRRIRRVIVPYVVWSFLFAIVNNRLDTFISDIFMSKCNGIYYFILVYMQMVVLTPLIFRVLKCKFVAVVWAISPITVFLIRYVCAWYNIVLEFPFEGELFAFWLIFFCFGLALRNGYVSLKFSKRQLIYLHVMTVLVQIAEGYVWYLKGNYDMATTQLKMSSIMTTSVLCAIVFFYIRDDPPQKSSIHPRILKVFGILGDYSFGIYLCHMLVIRTVSKLLPMLNVFPLNTMVVIVVSSICVMMGRRILGKYAYIIGL